MTINNNNIFGAFTLNDARGSRLTGDWLNKESVANYGWFGGGSSATVDRIDFSNDSATAQSRGSLSAAKYYISATGNSNYGWFGGGSIPGVSAVERIDFSNDSATASPRGPLSLGRFGPTATGNSNYGWFGGGSISNSLSIVDRIDFSNDFGTASIRGALNAPKQYFTATGNSNYGWFGGGFPSPSSTVDRIDFSNDSATASPRGPLSLARSGLSATGNSNYGWFGGGSSPGPTVSTVDRVDFANDSFTASVRGPLSASKYRLAASGNSNYGWFTGGNIPATPNYSTVDRIDFSNDLAISSPRGLLSAAKVAHAATSGVLNIRRQKAGNYGWFGGGSTSTPSVVATVDRIDFSNDSATASPRGSLSLSRYSLAATGNSSYGWFGGGVANPPFPTIRSTVDRIDFSNDSATASPRGPLSIDRISPAATGNSNYGWFSGGQNAALPTGDTATVDRINFSNDSATASPRGQLSGTRARQAATGNSNYAWFGGGYSVPLLDRYVSIIDRINFSNDSATASPRGLLSAARGYLAAAGNSNYGWFGGGYINPPITYYVTVDRINFSNDSVSALVRGPLSLARYELAATGNSNYGWFGGGYTPGTPTGTTITRVDRINFSNDSVSASVRGSLTNPARQQLSATSNTTR